MRDVPIQAWIVIFGVAVMLPLTFISGDLAVCVMGGCWALGFLIALLRYG
jgi:hypothetical protein